MATYIEFGNIFARVEEILSNILPYIFMVRDLAWTSLNLKVGSNWLTLLSTIEKHFTKTIGFSTKKEKCFLYDHKKKNWRLTLWGKCVLLIDIISRIRSMNSLVLIKHKSYQLFNLKHFILKLKTAPWEGGWGSLSLRCWCQLVVGSFRCRRIDITSVCTFSLSKN